MPNDRHGGWFKVLARDGAGTYPQAAKLQWTISAAHHQMKYINFESS